MKVSEFAIRILEKLNDLPVIELQQEWVSFKKMLLIKVS
jgi:hypothetical protein